MVVPAREPSVHTGVLEMAGCETVMILGLPSFGMLDRIPYWSESTRNQTLFVRIILNLEAHAAHLYTGVAWECTFAYKVTG